MAKQWRSIGLLLLLILLVSAFLYLAYEEVYARRNAPPLLVSYLDIGQGDATFIESPYGTQVLIDGGRDGSVLEQLPQIMGYFDRTIDMVVATHPDSDHIAGLIDVLQRYKVRTIVMTNNKSDTPVYGSFLRAVEAEGATVLIAMRGQIFDLGKGEAGSTTLTILFPDRDVENLESNTSSIIAKLRYGDADLLFTGDAPRVIETYLMGLDGEALQSEVLKIGHHGSRTSSEPAFVREVAPQLGIISAGKDNEYGHPHREVLDTLREEKVIVKNTAQDGTIFLESDGHKIWIKD